MTPSLSKQEVIGGSIYGLLQFLLLPDIALLLHNVFLIPLWSLQLGVFLINFVCTILIFRRFLLASWKNALSSPWKTLWVSGLCLALYYLAQFSVSLMIFYIQPDFQNLNDAGISSLAEDGGLWIAIGTVILVPVVEECLFRGLLFRGIYDRSPLLAWILSACGFSAVHILSYVGIYDGISLLLAFVQYLPAGLALSYAYRISGTIVAPILIHAVINFLGVCILL